MSFACFIFGCWLGCIIGFLLFVILQRMKGQQPPQPGNAAPVDDTKLNTMDAKIQALEVKLDKVIAHFGIK